MGTNNYADFSKQMRQRQIEQSRINEANGRSPEFSAPKYQQAFNSAGPGYIDMSGTDELARVLPRNNYWDDQLYGIQRLREAFGMGGGGGGSTGFISGGGGMSGGGAGMAGPTNYSTAQVPGVSAPDMTESNAQTFARAKDQVGQTSRASLQSLRDELGATGMLGSGSEAQSTQNIIAHGAGQMGEVSRENAVNEASQKADFAKMKYQGDITQRAQDLQAQQEAARLQLQREQMQQQMLLEALRGLSGGGGKTGGGGAPGTKTPGGGNPIWKTAANNPLY